MYKINIDKFLANVAKAAIREIKENIETTGTKASGRTAKSLRFEVENGILKIYGRPAFGTLEHGRAAGAVPKNFIEIIKQWAIDKKIPLQQKPIIRPTNRDAATRALYSFAGAVAYTIKHSGTRLYRDGGRKNIYTPALDNATKKIIDYFSMDSDFLILQLK